MHSPSDICAHPVLIGAEAECDQGLAGGVRGLLAGDGAAMFGSVCGGGC